ncbi:cystathionine gamma-synthase [Amycolatopsis antarctica]|uniref:Cystathionine gamma-synthase n=1 Tax=Amycolatopsis antarctica TaxID=1854586 RepID=A0A263D5F4_9PSEU|nr:PLP-dependent transferase [Amycolatopsis antarctica]OZM72827.1 cystathionine gamma-synthase [Amycolatopsis antarctica]
MNENEWSARTRAIQAGRPSGAGEPLNTPIVPASNFVAGSDRQYSRENGTPTWEAFEAAVGTLEGGTATAFASGLAAVSAVIDTLPIGAEVVVPAYSYGGTRALLDRDERLGRIAVRSLDPTDTEAWVAAAPEVDVLWLESPTNPTLDVMNIRAIVAAARDSERRPKVVVDSTFATPLGAQPLVDGADVVVHSATKLIGGHSDLLLGVTVSADAELTAELRRSRTLGGATPGVFEAWLALRGLRTLPVRYAAACATSARLAERLEAHAAVERVRFPGTGAMIAFELADAAAADKLCAGLRLITHATSLGGVESTVERRAGLEMDKHVPPGLVRFSVGLEDPEDLWRDLAAVLDTLT